MNKSINIFWVFICLILIAPIIQPAKSQSAQGITIDADGKITPSNAPIKRDGNTYTITADFNNSIIIERGSITIDGANHNLQGPGIDPDRIAVNITATNVTVKNMHITNWKTGILGAYNNNTITNNELTHNYQSIAIYADDYVVSRNNISSSIIALFIDGGALRTQGDNNFITQNQIADNSAAFDITNSDGTTITENNITNNDLISGMATNTRQSILYYNNFINNAKILGIPGFIFGGVYLSPAGQWDNGTVGNYWSDYLSKYPNASEIGYSGIGDTPYMFNDSVTGSAGTTIVLGGSVDRFPLMAPINISAYTPNPSPMPSSSLQPSPSPSPTPSVSPSSSSTQQPTLEPSPTPNLTPSISPSDSSAPTITPYVHTHPLSSEIPVIYVVIIIGVVIAVVGLAVYFKQKQKKQ